MSSSLRSLTTDFDIRQLDSLSTKAEAYEKLLRDIGNIVDGRTAEQIRVTLDKVCALCHVFFVYIPASNPDTHIVFWFGWRAGFYWLAIQLSYAAG